MKTKYVLETPEYTGVYYTGFMTPGGVPEMTNNIDNAATYDNASDVQCVRSILNNVHNKPLNIREVIVNIKTGKLLD